jgi:nitrogen-specific signal transduction histidine kinase
MASTLAHRINNPLQSLMNVAYLAAEGVGENDAKALGKSLSADLQRLSAEVSEALAPRGERGG